MKKKSSPGPILLRCLTGILAAFIALIALANFISGGGLFATVLFIFAALFIAPIKSIAEIKKKYRGLVNKRRTTLELGEAYDFIETGVKPELQDYMNGQVLNELEYCLNLYDLEPKVYIAYDGLAYFEKGNDDLRISFDTNIRTRRSDLLLESGDHGKRL